MARTIAKRLPLVRMFVWQCGIFGVLASKGDMRAATASSAFDRFVEAHGRRYRHGSPEYQMREALFEKRLAKLERHNNRPNRLWTAGINHLTDRTEEEFAQLRGWRGVAAPRSGGVVGDVARHQQSGIFLGLSGRTYAESVSWDHLNATTSIVDQGGCGSCWAVTSATVLQAHSEIYQAGSSRTFSAQAMVDCVPNPRSCGGTGGCDGATVELAFDYVMRNGLLSEYELPYEGATRTCRDSTQLLATAPQTPMVDIAVPGKHFADASSPGMLFGLQGWARLPENKYEPLMRAVAERGPVGVAVAANAWGMYDSGIFDDCGKDAVIDHAVTLIGYGRDRDLNQKTWLIQNSWGRSWGEQGKIRLLRRDTDEVEQCGTDRQPEVGTGCTGGPAEVRVCGMCGILYDNVVPYFQ